MICFTNNQNINYELACTNIYITSQKDCSVAPWEDNKRCCYISYKGGKECIFVNDTKEDLKAKKDEYEREEKKEVNIECYSSYIHKFIYSFIIIIIFFFILVN